MDELDREIQRRRGLGADVFSALASLVALGHDPAVEIQAQVGNLRDASRAAMRLAPLGWAPCGLLPVREYVRAGDVLDARGVGAADELLADAWEASGMLPGVLARIRALGAGIDASIRAVSERRGDLVEVAWRCHESDSFDASIPIVLAQVEGICFDVSGKAFFSKHPTNRADVTDEVLSLASTPRSGRRATHCPSTCGPLPLKDSWRAMGSPMVERWPTELVSTRGSVGFSFLRCGSGRTNDCASATKVVQRTPRPAGQDRTRLTRRAAGEIAVGSWSHGSRCETSPCRRWAFMVRSGVSPPCPNSISTYPAGAIAQSCT